MPNNPTHDPVTGREIDRLDDYDYTADRLRGDPRRHLPNDLESVTARQHAANAQGEAYYPSPWECWHKGKWWNVPEDEQAVLIADETADHPWQEILEPRLSERGLFRGSDGEVPTPWDGSLGEGSNWGNIVTVTRIGVLWLRLNPDSLGRGTANTKAISAIMRKLGWTLRRQRVPGMATQSKVWINPVPNAFHEGDSEGTNEFRGNRNGVFADTVSETTRTDDDDIPF